MHPPAHVQGRRLKFDVVDLNAFLNLLSMYSPRSLQRKATVNRPRGQLTIYSGGTEQLTVPLIVLFNILNALNKTLHDL